MIKKSERITEVDVKKLRDGIITVPVQRLLGQRYRLVCGVLSGRKLTRNLRITCFEYENPVPWLENPYLVMGGRAWCKKHGWKTA